MLYLQELERRMIDKLTQRKSGILVEYASCPRTYSNKFGVIFSEGVEQAHKLRFRRDSNPGLPDTNWAQLPTELQSLTLGARQI